MTFQELYNQLLNFDRKYYLIVILILIIALFYNMQNKKSENFVANSEETTTTIEEIEISSLAKHKLNLYYTNWCGYSQDFLPIWDDLVKSVSNNENLMRSYDLQKIDCERQRESCHSIQGFPTIMLHKSNGERIVYEGQRTTTDLLKFLTENI